MTSEVPPDSTGGPLGVGATLRIDVPSGGPLYDGHFPGQPILPGVSLLMLALRALHDAGAPPVLVAIESLRLRRLVTPGATIDLGVEALTFDGRTRFRIDEAGVVAANAVVVLGAIPGPLPTPCLTRVELASVEHGQTDERSTMATPLDELLPHRPPMRWVERVEQIAPEGGACTARIPADCALVRGGSIPAVAALELAAQAAALFEALRCDRVPLEAPPVGYLVGARGVRFARASLAAGETLHVAVQRTGSAPPLTTFDFEVGTEGAVVASGSVSTWLAIEAV
jgi:3-hydroxymyristoyl/3-hydroxydecanoyl-(acyl carrier protein) dehydratase